MYLDLYLAATYIALDFLLSLQASAMWYDVFSTFYDTTLERLYHKPREEAISVLNPKPGSVVLDIACGTGQNFPFLEERIGDGIIVGVDQSKGMLNQAEKRCTKAGWNNVKLVCSDIHEFDRESLKNHSGKQQADFVICALGLSVINDWTAVFQKSFDLLKQGGRFAIFDAHAEKRILQTWTTEWLSGADLSRKVWEPLEKETVVFEKHILPGSPRIFGGHLFVAVGEKP